MRSLQPTLPLLNQTISTSTPVQSSPLTLGYMAAAAAAWLVNVGSGLTATFQLMVSQDGINYYNSGQSLPTVSGSATIFPVQYSGAFPFALIQVTQSAGSGTVLITGSAKGVA